jgi:hypothetical protein
MEEAEQSVNFEHRITHMAGEVAGLREVNEYDQVDFARMWEAETSEGMVRWIGGGDEEPASKSVLRKFIRNLNKSAHYNYNRRMFGVAHKSSNSHLYGVTAQENLDSHEALPLEERGEIEGWVRTDSTREELDRYQRVMGCTLSSDTPWPVEMSYLKRPNGPRKLIASAVRQICLKILKEDSAEPHAIDEIPDQGRMGGHIVPKRPIMLFIEHDNVHSRKVAEDAGFEIVRENAQWKVENEPTDLLYLLNWDKLQQIVEEQTKTTVLKRLLRRF